MATNFTKQYFKSLSTGVTASIQLSTDFANGHRFVLWDDIKHEFENAKSVMNGEAPVKFNKYNNRQAIKHHPGIVLGVVQDEGTSSHSHDSRETTPATNATTVRSNSHKKGWSFERAPAVSACTASQEQDVESLSISNAPRPNSSLDRFSVGMTEESREYLSAYTQLYGDFFVALNGGEKTKAAGIRESMDKYAVLIEKMAKNHAELQEQLYQMQQQIHRLDRQKQQQDQEKQQQLQEKNLQIQQLQQQLQQSQQQLQQHRQLQQSQWQLQQQQQQLQEQQQQDIQERRQAYRSMDRKQDHIIQLQKQALIQIQALRVQDFELHEYPIPRLFIILRRPPGTIQNPFSDPFRLYFLCDCGSHTTPANSEEVHKVHLAKHDGYDLHRPSEFFQKYGDYLLGMMYIIKYGIVVAGVVVPALAKLDIADQVVDTLQEMKQFGKMIAPQIDDSIKYLQDIKEEMEATANLSTGRTGFGNVEAVEGVDLRKLESFLKDKDQDRALGNLYRIVTPKGHVKWVCYDHYRDAQKISATQEFRTTVENIGGTYIEEMGRVEITISASTQAQEFYEAMTKVGIHELDITLRWNVTVNELQALDTAVANAKVTRLTVKGTCQPTRPTFHNSNGSQRLDPTAQQTYSNQKQSFSQKVAVFAAKTAAKVIRFMEKTFQPKRITSGKSDRNRKLNPIVELISSEGKQFIPRTIASNFTAVAKAKVTQLSAEGATPDSTDGNWRVDPVARPIPSDQIQSFHIKGLSIDSTSAKEWLLRTASKYPARDCFPFLTDFGIQFSKTTTISSNCVSLITTMVSSPAQNLGSSQQSSKRNGMVKQQPSSKTQVTSSNGQTHLTRLSLERLELFPADWKKVIDVIDFSTLESLSLLGCNITREHLKLLVNRALGGARRSVPLRCLDIQGTYVVTNTNLLLLDDMLSPLMKMNPSIEIRV
ncbi:hypothetical protein BGX31_009261 [Mortierella sp. GBA43]|nr:hypothetical protein BGX31_009261 [Mortierella sp. GBA43]